jgi:hypothetical protein
MTITTLLCWLAFVFILWTVNPEEASLMGFSLFYLSLFLSLVGTASITGFIIRFIALRRELVFNSVKEAFRQSFLFAIFIIAILLLLSHNLFSWLNLTLLVVGLSMLEFFLISYHKPRLSSFNEGEQNL